MKNEKYKFGYNTARDRQYSILASENKKPYKTQLETEYDLMFFFENPTGERYGINGGFNVGIEDFANIARAVFTLSGGMDRIEHYVRRKYLTGYSFDEKAKSFVSKQPHFRSGLYTLSVEKERNPVLNYACYSNIFKLTFSYDTVFGNKDKFVIVLREQDFIGLGDVACKMLEKSVKRYEEE